MPVQFNEVPGNIRVPLWWAEINPAQAPLQSISRLLLIGQHLRPVIPGVKASGPNTGGGALIMDPTAPKSSDAPMGIYTLRVTDAGPPAVFTVTDPNGTALGTYTVGAAAFNNKIKFTITAAGGAWIVGDGFDVMVNVVGATSGIPRQIDVDPDTLFGYGSMLAMMAKVARKNAPFQEIWALPIADSGAGAAATGTFTIANAPPLNSGTLIVYITGRRVRIAVTTADTNSTIAARLAAAINATVDLPVTATALAAVVTVTARHLGALGNTISLLTDYVTSDGPLASELVTVAAMSGGSGDPDITTPLAALSDEEYDFLAGPYTDATNLGAINALLNGSSGRWAPISQLYGHYYAAKQETLANLSTFGNGLNDPHVSVMGYKASPSPPWVWAAAFGAKAAMHLQSYPEGSRPLQTLWMEGVLAPKLITDRFNAQQRQVLYYDGIASYHVRKSGEVCIDRAVTTYQLNDWGVPNSTWLDVETMHQAAYAVRYLKAKVTGVWGRASLRDENPHGIQGVATAQDVRDTIVHGYRELSQLNVVENEDLFEQVLVVERNLLDPNRVDAFIPADHVNQLRIIGVNYTTHLQLPGAQTVVGGGLGLG